MDYLGSSGKKCSGSERSNQASKSSVSRRRKTKEKGRKIVTHRGSTRHSRGVILKKEPAHPRVLNREGTEVSLKKECGRGVLNQTNFQSDVDLRDFYEMKGGEAPDIVRVYNSGDFVLQEENREKTLGEQL